ncbi:hypothetical protein [Anaerophaga thermohalophila]|uniref:hypothetical protein n=1 Tax=Anaerophaga thermohalophila TaxID=177400 RepID=UPI000237D3A7|nr:hypothetical protein [Anaerophaga thermohalophila]
MTNKSVFIFAICGHPVDVDFFDKQSSRAKRQATSHKETDLKSGIPNWCEYTILTLITGTIPGSQGFTPSEALTKPDTRQSR